MGNKNNSVSIVEHILAALAIYGIDNYDIELDGPEMLTLDGSGKELASAILDAKIKKQEEPRTFLKVLRPVGVDYKDGRRLMLFPNDKNDLSVNFNVDFPHVPAVGKQEANYNIGYGTNLDIVPRIAKARTLGLHGGKMQQLK